MAGQMAAIPAALLSGFKELFELLSDGAKAVSQLADQAAKLQRLSVETDLSLSSLQKVDYAAQLKGLEFDKIQEDLPKLAEKYKEKAEGKSFEQFLIDLSNEMKKMDPIKAKEFNDDLGLNRETMHLLRNDSVLPLDRALNKVDSNKLVRSDDEMAQLVELSYAINSLKATTNSVGSERIAGSSDILMSLSKGTEDILLKRVSSRLDRDDHFEYLGTWREHSYRTSQDIASSQHKYNPTEMWLNSLSYRNDPYAYLGTWREHPDRIVRGPTPDKHTPLDPVEMWNEVMQHSPRPYDFGDKYREKAEQVSQMGDSIIGALSKFGEKINQVCTQLAPFSDVLQSIVQQIPYLPPPTQAEIDACRNKPGIFARGGILQAKLDAIRGPGEGPTPWTGVSDTALALNAAGTTGLSLGAGSAGRAGKLQFLQKLKHAAAGLRLDFTTGMGYI